MPAFDARRVEARLEDFCTRTGARIPFSLSCDDTVASTNDLVKAAIRAGCSEGRAFMAGQQHAGYGRQGRSWTSPWGGAYVSVCLRPDVPLAQLPTLSLVASLAVRAALERLGCAHDIQIKWPNDIVCPAGKLCGISLEALAGGVCVGIGVNVFRPVAEQAVGGKNVPAYAFERLRADSPFAAVRDAGATASVGADGLSAEQARVLEDAVACVLAELEPRYERWQREGFAAFAQEYNERLSLRGVHVEAVSLDGTPIARGAVERADERGLLVLRHDDGSVSAVGSGEIHLTRIG